MKKVDLVVHAAMERSQAVVDAIPNARETHRTNAQRAIDICKELVTTKPAQEPLAPRIAEVGDIRYGRFPSKQSLLNRYSEILRVWRRAYRDIINLSAPKTVKAADSMADLEDDLAPLDSGTRARFHVAMQVAREQKLENDRLKHLIREQIPAPRRDRDATPAVLHSSATISTVKRWMNSLASGTGPLEMDTSGVRVTRHARPRQVVIPAEVVVALEVLCGVEATNQTPDLPISTS